MQPLGDGAEDGPVLVQQAERGIGLQNGLDSRRIVLEAKRLLAHTDRPIYLVAEGLGFDEATNFSKFFRRAVGQAPAEFRAVHRQAAS